MLDSGFFILCGSSLPVCHLCEVRAQEGKTFHFQSPISTQAPSPLGNPIKVDPFVLNTLLAFTYFLNTPQHLIKSPVSPQNSALRVFCQGGTPPEVMDPVLFTEY